MRKFLTLGAASVAFLSASQAMAADSTVSYDIQSRCEVITPSSLSASISSLGFFALNVADAATVVCDDPNGASLTMTTANGGLQNTTDPTIIVDYQATINPAFDLNPSNAYSLTLTTDGTPLASVTELLPASLELTRDFVQGAAGSGNAVLSAAPQEPFPLAGTYADTLTIDISAN